MTHFLRLVIGLGLGWLLACGLWAIAVIGQIGKPHPDHQWVVQAYEHKLSAATHSDTPRVLIAGGSSAMFGIDSTRVEERLGRPTVNLGVNAGIGLPVILNRTLAAARQGDLIVMALEYPLFGYSGEINHVMNDFYLGHPEELLSAWRLSSEALPLYRSLPLVVKESVQILMQTSMSRVRQGYLGLPPGFEVTGTYGAHHLDPRGDQIHTELAKREEWMLEQVKAIGPHHYGAEHSETAEGWLLLRHFQQQLRARGACIVIVPPAFLYHDLYASDPLEKAFYSSLPDIAAQHGLLYAGSPFDFMYDLNAMYDTDYHLIAEARATNTRRLLDALHEAISTANKPLEGPISCANLPVQPGMAR